MKIEELTHEQKETFCVMMAQQGYYEEIDSAYSNALDFLGIEEPNDNKFRYDEGIGGDLYQEVGEAMTKVLYLQLMFAAIYDSGNFAELASENKGYEFALSMLDNLKSINSKDDFSDFIDSLDI